MLCLAWVQTYIFQTDALVLDIVSPRKWSRDCLFFDWDSLSEIPSSMGRKELKVEHISTTVLTVSVRDCLFQIFPVQVDLVEGGNAFHCIVFVALFLNVLVISLTHNSTNNTASHRGAGR